MHAKLNISSTIQHLMHNSFIHAKYIILKGTWSAIHSEQTFANQCNRGQTVHVTMGCRFSIYSFLMDIHDPKNLLRYPKIIYGYPKIIYGYPKILLNFGYP